MALNEELKVIRLIQGNLDRLPDAKSKLRVLEYLSGAVADNIAVVPTKPNGDPRQTTIPGAEQEEQF